MQLSSVATVGSAEEPRLLRSVSEGLKMNSLSIEVSDPRSIAERNQEINRRRFEKRHGDGVKVTDPAALEHFWNDLRQREQRNKDQQQRREMERASKEGQNYKSPEQRQKDAQLAKRQHQEGEETKILEGRFDPYKNYYQLLGADRSASLDEIKKLYKKLALAFHPDKQRRATEEQRAAIQLQFQEIREAFDVLSDEELRTVYDRVRDYMDIHGDRAMPSLTPREAGLMRQGMGELSRLRRQGMKLKRHEPRFIEVSLSLEQLNGGCVHSVTVIRHRVDDHGLVIDCPKVFHLILRKGTAEGSRLTFEKEGDEALDTHPGDLVFVLKQRSHQLFRKRREKDLEILCPAAEIGQVFYFREVETISGRLHGVHFHPVAESLRTGGHGGVWEAVFRGDGLLDTADPWENPPGDLYIKVRYPPITAAVLCVRFTPLLALGCQNDLLSGSVAGCAIAEELNRRQLTADILSDADRLPPVSPLGTEAGVAERTNRFVVVHLHCGENPAAEALTRCLVALCPSATVHSAFVNDALSTLLMDDECLRLDSADVVILDFQPSEATRGDKEAWRHLIRARLEHEGLWAQIVERRFSGAWIVALGDSCAFLGEGASTDPSSPSFLPFLVRSGGGEEGWGDLYASIQASPSTTPLNRRFHRFATARDIIGVGIMKTAVLLIDGISHEAESLIAPTKDMIAATSLHNLAHRYLPNYRYHDIWDDIADRGYSERCSKACFASL